MSGTSPDSTGALTGTYPNPALAPGAVGPDSMGSPLSALVIRSAPTPTTDGLGLTVSFTKELYDTAGMHSPVTDPERLVAPRDGVYLASAQLCWQTPSAATEGYRRAQIVDADVEGPSTSFSRPVHEQSHASVGEPLCQSMSGPLEMDAGDYVELSVLQTSGSSIDLNGSVTQPIYLGLHWLGPAP